LIRNETLASVCARNESLPVDDVVATIFAAQDADQKVQISPGEVAERLRSGEQIPLIDVRSREEWDAVHIDSATFFHSGADAGDHVRSGQKIGRSFSFAIMASGAWMQPLISRVTALNVSGR
jgi:hypothetical protein